jgi:uncharacterized repeat protein (TIGR03803 family)
LGYKSSDGLDPHCGLVLSGNTLFGTTMDGGLGFPVVFGTVFAVDTDGTAPRLLQAFDHVIGHTPEGGLVLSGNTLYGTTYDTIFSINTDGSGFTLLHSASGTDGLNPVGLVISGNAMYGAAYSGGTWTNGAIFAVLADGTAYTLLHSFTATSPGSPSSPSTNSDGSNPLTGLVLSGDTLYGTAEYGGVFGAGTAFSLKTDGSGFRVLHNFDGTNAAGPSDLVVVGTTIYGAASLGSTWSGILFSMNTDGSGFTVLCNINHGFGAGGLVVTNNTIYGTSYYGGTSDTGTIFKFPLLPQLTITASGPNTILAWPTNPTGFSLQSTASLTTSASWTTVSPGPVVVNGQNTVTNPISGAQQFFRLSQ